MGNYTQAVREHLLLISIVKEIVCIIALITVARQVFGCEELIHELVLTKSSLDIGRKLICSRADSVFATFKDDAYYNTF